MAKQDVTVELFYDSAWNDHTSDVYTRDDIRITHGATDAYSHAQPASCRLTFDNRDGEMHPRNPNSSLFGKIGRNTPVRVTVGASVRFSGEVASWIPRRAVDDGDAWIEARAAGLSRRIGQGSTPLRSALYYGLKSNQDDDDLVAYWPCEDGENATQIASALTDAEPLSITGDVEPAKSTPLPATDALPELNSGQISGPIPTYTIPSDQRVGIVFFLDVPSGGLTNEALLCRVDAEGDIASLEVRYLTGGDLRITLTDDSGSTSTGDTSGGWISVDDRLQILHVSMQESSLDPNDVLFGVVRRRVNDDGTLVDFEGAGVDNNPLFFNNATVGTATKVTLGDSDGLGDAVVGHVAVVNKQLGSDVFPYTETFISAALGEPAGDRVERLADEVGVTMAVTGTAADTQALGPQLSGTLLELLRDAAFTDLGILADDVTVLGLRYRTGRDLYSQDAVLTLDWDSGEVAPPLEPNIDDLNVRNDVEVKRPDGASFRVEQDTGPLSVESWPDGVGRYDTSDEVNIVSDGFLEDQAAWRLHLGTSDETRFPRVTVDLDATPGVDVSSIRIGDRLDLINLPDDVSVDDVSLLVFGWAEIIGSHRRKITFNCAPEAPYRVAEVEGGASVGTVGSTSATLNEDLTDAETDVDIDCGAAGAWVHEGTDYDITVNGERMTVTAVGAAAGTFPDETQTLTVTRSVNGVTKTHSNGDDIAMTEPSYIGL